MSNNYEAVIGLECHVQLLTNSKIFTSASAAFGGAPNEFTDPYTLGLPGSLPVLNRETVEFALRMGLATHSKIRMTSRFARKHYFYPDLPKGYQISQHDEPLCEGGYIEFLHEGHLCKVRLTRIHIEEDAGKNIHVPGGKQSLVDFNRAGVGLIEIVSEPDIKSAAEAAEYLRMIRKMVRFLGISDGNMEEGSLRCDANVSVKPVGQVEFGVKVEVKNINSFKYVQKAIEYEIKRQTELAMRGEKIISETRGWNTEKGVTYSQRSKEKAQDYRYFPDPDLPPLVIDEAWLEKVRTTLPETPLARRSRYIETCGLTAYDADVLTAEQELGLYYDQVLVELAKLQTVESSLAKMTANFITSELLGALNRDNRTIEQSPVSASMMAELLLLLHGGTITGKTAKDIFIKVYAGEGQPRQLVESSGLSQVSDEGVLREICEKIVADISNAKQLEKYRAGNDKLLGFFVGLVMKETGGRAQPELVNQLLRELLQS